MTRTKVSAKLTGCAKPVKIRGMRTAAATPEPIATDTKVVRTTTTQILPADPVPPERKMVDFWKYIEALKPEDWSRHIVYIYRTEPRVSNYTDGPSVLEKSTGYLEVRPGLTIPFNSQEEVELAIKEKHGGKAFRLILKRGSERIAEAKISNDMPPKFPPVGMSTMSADLPGAPVSTSTDATADVAKTAMATMAGQDRAAIEIANSVLRSSADMVQRLAQGPQNGAGDDLTRQVMTALINKALNPPDPLELITRILPLINRPSGSPAAGVDRLMDAAIERFLSPSASGPVASAGAELVRQLPSVAGYVTQAIQHWRAGMEAQRDTAAIMTRTPSAAAAPPQPVPRQLPPTILPQQPPQPAAQPEAAGGNPLPLEFIETKIMEILNEGNPEDDAADDTLTFLNRLDPQLIAYLFSLGEAGLLQLFQQQPLLRPALTNMPRLTKFIKEFIKLAGGSAEEPPAGPGAPAAA